MIQYGNKMLEVEENLLKWAKSQIPDLEDMTPLREQASSRQYFRASSARESFILVFSDPQRELNNEFIKYSEFLIKNQVSVPRIEAFDLENGFMLMEDFGDKVFQNEINTYNQKDLYLLAIDQIIKLQLAAKNEDIGEFNEISAKEQMELFEEWFLSSYLKLEINESETKLIKDAYVSISRRFLGQKRTL